jgi:hypothetical protein
VWFIRTVPDRLLRADPRRAAQRTLLEPTMSDECVASARDLTAISVISRAAISMRHSDLA